MEYAWSDDVGGNFLKGKKKKNAQGQVLNLDLSLSSKEDPTVTMCYHYTTLVASYPGWGELNDQHRRGKYSIQTHPKIWRSLLPVPVALLILLITSAAIDLSRNVPLHDLGLIISLWELNVQIRKVKMHPWVFEDMGSSFTGPGDDRVRIPDRVFNLSFFLSMALTYVLPLNTHPRRRRPKSH